MTCVDATDLTSAGLVELLAQVPLVHRPGTAVEFDRSTDVLGCGVDEDDPSTHNLC